MIRLVLNGIRRRPLRSLLTAAGIAVAVGAFTAITGIARGYMATWSSAHTETGSDIVGFEAGLIEVMSSRLPETLPAALLAADGVADATGVLSRMVVLDGRTDSLFVNGTPLDGLFWRAAPLIEGAPPVAGMTPPGMVIGDRAAAALEVGIGDRISLIGQSVEITGIAAFEGALNAYSGLMALPDLQAIAARPSSITYVALAVTPSVDDVLDVADRLNAHYPEVDFAPGETVAETYDVNRMLETVAGVVSLFSLCIGFLLVINTMAMAVEDRRGELALLQALGWGRRRVVGLIAAEAALMVAVGTVAGTLGGVLTVEALSRVPAIAPFLHHDPSFVADAARALAIAAIGALVGLLPAAAAVRGAPGPLLGQE